MMNVRVFVRQPIGLRHGLLASTAATEKFGLERMFRSGLVRLQSTVTAPGVAREEEKAESKKPNDNSVVSYWGVSPAKVSKEDGTDWKWNSFRVHTYMIYIPHISVFNMIDISH